MATRESTGPAAERHDAESPTRDRAAPALRRGLAVLRLLGSRATPVSAGLIVVTKYAPGAWSPTPHEPGILAIALLSNAAATASLLIATMTTLEE